jgi:two-component system, OmpR family, phosphate regulon response regulator PhoB
VWVAAPYRAGGIASSRVEQGGAQERLATGAVAWILAAPVHGFGLLFSMTSDASPDRLVVVIDDEAIILTGMEIMLDSWGYRVIAAETGEAALAALRAQTPTPVPCVIVSDYRLRGLSGVEVVRALRGLCGAPVPAIILTGDTGADLVAAAQVDGLTVVHKPVAPSDLRVHIDRLAAKG